MTKMKVVDKYRAIQAMLRGEAVENFTVEDAQTFLDERIVITEKKNANPGERKPTKTQLENEDTKACIMEVLTTIGAPASILDIQKASETLATLSNQKLSALLKQLRESGHVNRTEVKGKPYYEAC